MFDTNNEALAYGGPCGESRTHFSRRRARGIRRSALRSGRRAADLSAIQNETFALIGVFAQYSRIITNVKSRSSMLARRASVW